jgi:crotonobetainyl-CoA:carnitine CoA-transferase CaiB-like acyl-CoA transferase
MKQLLNERPLHCLRVIELAAPCTIAAGRLLADLGAELLVIEQQNRTEESLRELVASINKSSITLADDSATAKQQFDTQLAEADVLLYDGRSEACQSLGISASQLKQRYPQLTLLSVSDFGLSGPYKDYAATNAVQLAMTAVLARSGIEGQSPLLPPGQLAWQTAAVQTVWALMTALWQRSRIGVGSTLDCSVFESVAQVIDPGLGVTGSASAGRSATEMASFGRPPVGWLYPIFSCADGNVRACVLNPRQWHGLSEWLGSDHPFTDPKYGNLVTRYPVIPDINKLVGKLFADKTVAEILVEAQRRGVPMSQLATPSQAMDNPQFIAREAFSTITAKGKQAQLPSGYLELDGVRLGVRQPITTACPANRTATFPESISDPGNTTRRPFADLRVLDLGVIVAGAEVGRLFADMGADVIKVENSTFADGLRQSPAGTPISQSFAQGSRNKQSLGLNLRNPEGMELFKQLAAKSDVLLSNFKPGTLESLGIDYQSLSAINPGIVVVESSALGNTGPLAKSMGYGPLVRASSGLSGLWSYPEIANSFSDSITIFPDHFAARVAAIGVVTALLRREITGKGGNVVVSQAETIMNALAPEFLGESLNPGSLKPQGNISPLSGLNCVFPCAGDDQWCVIDFRHDQDWQQFVHASALSALDDPAFASSEQRSKAASDIEAIISDWTASLSGQQVTDILQAAGVPSSKMIRLTDFDDNPQFLARNFFRQFEQPGFPGVLQTENGPVGVSDLPDPQIQPAPFQGQHTRSIAKRLLGMDDSAIDKAIESGALEDIAPDFKQYLPN